VIDAPAEGDGHGGADGRGVEAARQVELGGVDVPITPVRIHA
jgi:hypothetical protein